jgi:hypothetical protein
LLGIVIAVADTDPAGAAARFWRIDPAADYGLLNGVARHRIRTKLIVEHWDDMLRLAGSLKLGTVQAISIMKTLWIDDHPTKQAQAGSPASIANAPNFSACWIRSGDTIVVWKLDRLARSTRDLLNTMETIAVDYRGQGHSGNRKDLQRTRGNDLSLGCCVMTFSGTEETRKLQAHSQPVSARSPSAQTGASA